MFLFHVLSLTSSDLFLAFVRPFKAEDKITRLLNAHRPSWPGHAMEPVLNNRLRAFPIRRADAACKKHVPLELAFFDDVAVALLQGNDLNVFLSTP